MIRIDMSEYGESTPSPAWSVPPGYIGYDQAARLTEAVAAGRTPWCCSTRSRRPTDVFDVLLQILTRDGDRRPGPHVDFRNTS